METSCTIDHEQVLNFMVKSETSLIPSSCNLLMSCCKRAEFVFLHSVCAHLWPAGGVLKSVYFIRACLV